MAARKKPSKAASAAGKGLRKGDPIAALAESERAEINRLKKQTRKAVRKTTTRKTTRRSGRR